MVSPAARQEALAHVREAARCSDRGDIQGAYQHLATAISKDLRCLEAHIMLARLHRKTGARQAAIREFETVIGVAPSSPEAAEARQALRSMRRR